MSEICLREFCCSFLKVAKGAAGAGCCSPWMRSWYEAVAASSEDASGMKNSAGKKITLSDICSNDVLMTYNLYQYYWSGNKPR